VAYYTLKAQKGYLARMPEQGAKGNLPTAEDLREAEQWADADVNQLIIEIAGAKQAAGHISAFQSSPPVEISMLAYLLGSAHVWDRRTRPKSTSEMLRELAAQIADRIRLTGYVTLSDGTLYALAGKKRRGIRVEDPQVRGYPLLATDKSHGVTSRQNLESLFLTANVEAPIL